MKTTVISLCAIVGFLIGQAIMAHVVPAQSCERTIAPIVVDQDDGVIAHAQAAIRQGAPVELILERTGAAQRRKASLRGIKTRPGFDRDEYPPAISAQGGAGADVLLIPRSSNRAQGASMRAQLAPYCNGQHFIFYDLPGR